MEEKDKFLKIIGLTGTKQILDFISEYGTAQYKDFRPFMNTHTLNRRLKELLIYGFREYIFPAHLHSSTSLMFPPNYEISISVLSPALAAPRDTQGCQYVSLEIPPSTS
jgi:hypothetical protein